MTVRLADYVIAHELVHLCEGHHGPEFRATLGRAMPDWQKRKDALADKAKDYLVFVSNLIEAARESGVKPAKRRNECRKRGPLCLPFDLDGFRFGQVTG